MPRTEFHPLTVAQVDQLTDDSAAVTFDVPPQALDAFAFAPGQSLTIRRGQERRQSDTQTRGDCEQRQHAKQTRQSQQRGSRPQRGNLVGGLG